MKKILLLLAMAAASVASLSAQNTPGNESTQAPRDAHGNAVSVKKAAQPANRRQVIYYISRVDMAGSHIPVVVRRYNGEDSQVGVSAHGAGYGSNSIAKSGSVNVGGALRSLDPAITVR